MRLLRLIGVATMTATVAAPVVSATVASPPAASVSTVARRASQIAKPPTCPHTAPIGLLSRLRGRTAKTSGPTVARTVFRNANPAGCLSIDSATTAARAGAVVAGGNAFVGLPLVATLLAVTSVVAGAAALASTGNSTPSSP